MLHDQELLDRLTAFAPVAFDGEVFRATRRGRDRGRRRLFGIRRVDRSVLALGLRQRHRVREHSRAPFERLHRAQFRGSRLAAVDGGPWGRSGVGSFPARESQAQLLNRLFAERARTRARNRTTTAAPLESIESSRTPPLPVLRNISRSSTVLDPQGLSNTGRDIRNWIQTAAKRSPSRTPRARGTDLSTKSAS
jgi:hypothetical protein